MARAKKEATPKTVDQRIADVDKEIENLKTAIADQRAYRKKLLAEKQNEADEQKKQIAIECSLTPDELREAVKLFKPK